MNASFKAALLALNALEGIMPAPIYGLTESNSSEGTFLRQMEDYGWSCEFSYELSREGIEISYAELVGREQRIVVPLRFFTCKDLDMVAEEIQVALNEKYAHMEPDPRDDGDARYDAWREKQYAAAADAAEDFGMTKWEDK